MALDPEPVRPDVAAAMAVFGYGTLRGGQREAIDAVLAGRDAVIVLPTGAGKSTCYQLPALIHARAGRGCTIVVSPLIALMNDQVEGLRARGIAAAAFHSSLSDEERSEAVRALMQGELALLYVSPERALLDSFKRLLARTAIAMIAIDEAHCVSQWGHDFRPEYMRLHELREVVDAPMMGLTATATPRVLAELAGSLGLRDPARVLGDFRRPNLAFEVRHHRGDAARMASLIEALEGAGLRGRTGGGHAIVYCSTRKKTEAVASQLQDAGFAAGHYHAGRTALARERAMTAFSVGRLRVLVATSAFGMGVDYPDVRVLVHFQAPGSLEAYYQEAGRAGRDGLPARCVLMFGPADLAVQRRLHDHATGAGSGRDGVSAAARHESGLAAVERYANQAVCRQQQLCAHFTGTEDHAACGCCDACLDPEGCSTVSDEPVEALAADQLQTIIAAVGELPRPVGKGALTKALRGSRAKAVQVHGLLRLSQHGSLAACSEASVEAAVEQLIRERKLVRRGRKYPTLALPTATPHRERAARTTDRTPRTARPSRTASIAIELDRFRKRRARELRWKAYMVFQRNTIAAIDKQRPQSHEALARIPGLGPAKIARFGDEILAVVRRYTQLGMRRDD
ncbi:MAG: ATP-dependent DNA helicase RecQ [Deltaproteobacteria bacterium]|nr:ATP-dependent DNA helicase RecQ [Deltaproteobacteria bacterium]